MLNSRFRAILGQSFQLVLLIAIIFAAYFPALSNGFIWDDDRYIEQNLQLRSVRGLERIWLWPLKAEPQYYPLTHTTLWVEYQVWGAKPVGYHLDNILLHTMSAVLLWRILVRLKIGGAWWAAMIFAVHPLQVETVAWATERKNVLSGVLYFGSLWAYLRTRWGSRIWGENGADEFGWARGTPSPSLPRSTGGGGKGPSCAGWYAASLVLFCAALLAKSVASTLPAAILLLVWWKRGKIRACDIWPLAPMFCFGVAMGGLTGWMEKHIVGAIGAEFGFLTPVDRICIAGRAVWFYLVKLVWPRPLMFIYPYWRVDPGERWWWVLFPAAAAGVLAACVLLRRKIGRGPATAGLFFVGTLTPALGFVNVFPMRYSYVADHFQYIACVGVIVLVVESARRVVARGLRLFRGGLGEPPPLPSPGVPGAGKMGGGPNIAGAIGVVCGAVVVGVLCVAANGRARVLHDRMSLWANTLAKNPNSGMVHNNYAAALGAAGEIEAAKAEYRKAFELDGDAGDLVGLGQCFAREGDYAAARDLYLKAIAATPVSDEPVLRHMLAGREFQLGTAYQGLAGKFPERASEYLAGAEAAYRRAIELYPEYEDPRINLAVMLADMGRAAEAIEQCEAVLAEDPESVSAHMNMAQTYYFQGRIGEALREYNRALELDPNNVSALGSIGAILAQEGKIDEAIAMLRRAQSIDPNNPLIQQNLAAAIAVKSRNAR